MSSTRRHAQGCECGLCSRIPRQAARHLEPRNWTVILAVVLAVFCAFATGAYIATKFVSPCVCIYAQARTIQ